MSRFAVGDVVVMADGRYTVRSFSWFGDLVNLWLEGDDGRAFTVPEAWLPDPEPREPKFDVGQPVAFSNDRELGAVVGVLDGGRRVVRLFRRATVTSHTDHLTPVTLVERPERETTVREMHRAMDNLASWPDRRAVAQALYDLLFGAG